MPEHRRYQDQPADWNGERGRGQRQQDWQHDDWLRRGERHEQPYEHHGEEQGPRERLVSGGYLGGGQGQQSDRDVAGGQRHYAPEPGYGRGQGYGHRGPDWGGYRQEGGWQRGRGQNEPDQMNSGGYGQGEYRQGGYGHDGYRQQGGRSGGWYGEGRGQPGQQGSWGSTPYAEPFGGQQYAGQQLGGRQESAGGRMSGQMSSGDPWSSGGQGEHRGRGPKNYTRSDERIREDVCDRLCDDPALDASDIEVKVASGEVTLSGQVASRDERRRAEDCAEQISGAKHVQNNLRVKAAGLQAGAHGSSQADGASSSSAAAGSGSKSGTQH